MAKNNNKLFVTIQRLIALSILFAGVGGMMSYALDSEISMLPTWLPEQNNTLDDSTKSKSSTSKDSIQLRYPLKSDQQNESYQNNIDLKTPSNITETVRYNPQTRKYDVYQTVGGRSTYTGKSYTLEEYLAKTEKTERSNYYQQRSQADDNVGGFGKRGNSRPAILDAPQALDKLFGGGIIDIQYSGMAEINLGAAWNTVRNPQLPTQQQRPPGQLVFEPTLQMNVRGSIGNYINMGINYNTGATFEFENQTKLNWQGKEDDIIQGIELGNVSLPMNGSLIQGGNALFGVKTNLKFGRLQASLIFTQSRGQTTEKEVSGGAQVTEFNIQANNYDQNRHYFLGQTFRDNYDQSLSTLPVISSPYFINYVEVWVTNTQGSAQNTRDIITFMDLGDANPWNQSLSTTSNNPYIDNRNNKIYDDIIIGTPEVRSPGQTVDAMQRNFPTLQQGLDWDILSNARLLTESEFTYHPNLGYISLNAGLNNTEILAVSYEYTVNGRVFKVGEFARDFGADTSSQGGANRPAMLFTKMLKGTTIRTRLPMWDLMMKNIYSLGTYNLSLQDFKLNVIYADDPSGSDLAYLPVDNVAGVSGLPLITVLNLDRINRQQEAKPDGVFDLINRVTINTEKAQVIFPVVEPFGSHLANKLGDPDLAKQYTYQSLYDSTKWLAEQDVSQNKFFLRGSYTGTSSAEIMIGAFNIPEGAVTVTSNGLRLTENVDYIVDYNIGKVTIINQGILSSGSTIKVSAENNAMFNLQQKTLVGGRFDYTVNKNLLFGATAMHMYERPLTPKTNIGSEPILNTIIGLDGSYSTDSRFLTKMVDKIPFIETKERSTFLIQGEYARLIAHEPKSIQNDGNNNQRGVSLVDDFEASETQYDLRGIQNWKYASVPQKQPDLFPEVQIGQNKQWNNYNANLAFYSLDPVFFRNERNTPEHLTIEDKSNHYARQVRVEEVFPNRNIPQGTPNIVATLDLAFYPQERGSYNFNTNTSDLNANGLFTNPNRTWGGITRRLETNDFQAANIAYLEFWLMDPFIYSSNNKGQLYFNLGEVSEDQIPDGRKSFENGYAADGNNAGRVERTSLANVPITTTLNNFFDNDQNARTNQDIGLDGLTDEEEREFWKDEYLDEIANNFGTNSPFFIQATQDPCNDNYVYYNDPNYSTTETGITDRYKRFNKQQGNSNDNRLDDGTAMSGTLTPDDEDINRDFTMNTNEDYFQYKVDIDPAKMNIGENFITDIVTEQVLLQNGKTEPVSWYQFKIPITEYQRRVGNIDDFQSIRFMRMFLKNFDSAVICRFAALQLVRTDWRIYENSLKEPGPVIPVDPNDRTVVLVNTVNVENNSTRKPIPYVLPPTLTREIDPTQPGALQQNEQSLSLVSCDLQDGDARGVFRTTNYDMRNYKNLQMFIHAEGQNIQDDELTAFIRFGTDLERNYYEYEIPLKITPTGAVQPIEIWPEANNLDLDFGLLFSAKERRLQEGKPLNKPYSIIDNQNGGTVNLLGLPDLSNVRVIMLGIRNKSGKTVCPEVWFNELRLSGHNNQGGWAAVGRMQTKLADFGTINLTGSASTIGFGGIQQTLNERNLEETWQYDLASNFELGKFFPQASGVSIPMFIGYTETFITPKYNPFNPDVELQQLYNRLGDGLRDSIRNITQTYQSRYSINFTNVQKKRVGNKKALPWDIENFNVSYSFNRAFNRSPQIERNLIETYRASLGYNYNPRMKSFRPFEKLIKSNQKWRILKDARIDYLPQSVNIRLDADRRYSELLNRSNDLFKSITPVLYDKNFVLTRFYSMNWKLMPSIGIDYNALVNARIEEPVGELNTEAKRDTVRRELYNFGRMTDFNQQANITYAVPFNKIKPLNWITTDLRYSSTFSWNQAPPSLQDVGNTIGNSADQSIAANLNLIKLYSKIPALRNINRGIPPPAKKKKKKKGEEKKDDKNDQGDGNEIKKKKNDELTAFHQILRGLMMIRNVNLSYTQRDANTLPGFNRQIDHFGNNFLRNTPGLPYAFGNQEEDFRYRMAAEGNLSNSLLITNFYTLQNTRTLNLRSTVEPIKNFRINLTFEQTYSDNAQGQFRFDTSEGFNDFRDLSSTQTGTFSSTYIFIRTAFEPQGDKDNNYESEAFTDFLNNRFTIAQRLQNEDTRVRGLGRDTANGGFPVGYGRTSQDMYYVNFLASYAGRNVNTSPLSPFIRFPLPSWNINYNGLSKIKSLKKIFNNIALSHSYVGRYTIGGYNSVNAIFKSDSLVPGTNLEPELQISAISISERFSPLIGVNFSTKSGITGRINYNKSRLITFVPRSFQLNENRREEIVISGGYRVTGLLLPFKSNGKRIYLKNDFNFNLDVSIMDNISIVRNIEQELNTPNSGQRIVSIKPNIQYKINEALNMNIYYNRQVTNPAVANSFPTALTNLGVRMQYIFN